MPGAGHHQGHPSARAQTAFTGVSWPRISRTQWWPGTPEGYGGAGWPRPLFEPSPSSGASNLADRRAMSDGRRAAPCWGLADALVYLLTLAWLHILDALACPTPATPAD